MEGTNSTVPIPIEKIAHQRQKKLAAPGAFSPGPPAPPADRAAAPARRTRWGSACTTAHGFYATGSETGIKYLREKSGLGQMSSDVAGACIAMCDFAGGKGLLVSVLLVLRLVLEMLLVITVCHWWWGCCWSCS